MSIAEYYGYKYNDVIYNSKEYAFIYKKIDGSYHYQLMAADGSYSWRKDKDVEIKKVELLDFNIKYKFNYSYDNEVWPKIMIENSKLGRVIF